jgi:hypothetical protein
VLWALLVGTVVYWSYILHTTELYISVDGAAMLPYICTRLSLVDCLSLLWYSNTNAAAFLLSTTSTIGHHNAALCTT